MTSAAFSPRLKQTIGLDACTELRRAGEHVGDSERRACNRGYDTVRSTSS